MMEKGIAIEIRKVSNGYIVDRGSRACDRNTVYPADECNVFETMESLLAFIKDHFTVPTPTHDQWRGY